MATTDLLLAALTGALAPVRFQTPLLVTLATTTAQELMIGPASTNQVRLTSSIVEFNVGTVAGVVKLPTVTSVNRKGLFLWLKAKGTTGSLTIYANNGTSFIAKLAPGESVLLLSVNSAWHTFRGAVPVTEGAASVTATGTVTMTAASLRFQKIDGGASDRNVLLPDLLPSASYFIANAGTTNSLVIKDAAGTTTVTTLLPGAAAWIVSTGAVWAAFADAPIPVKGATTSTVSGTVTLTRTSTQHQKINGGGADRDVMLPVIYLGAEYHIVNSGGTNNLVIKHSSGAPTVVTLPFGANTWIVANADATAWVNAG